MWPREAVCVLRALSPKGSTKSCKTTLALRRRIKRVSKCMGSVEQTHTLPVDTWMRQEGEGGGELPWRPKGRMGKSWEPDALMQACIPSTLEAEDDAKLEASLIYTASSRPARPA